jgi:transposase InsO family protein
MKMEEEHAYLIDIIKQIRIDHPTMNCRAMYYKIQPQTLGRDKFESLCSVWGLSVEKPMNYHRTTNSFGVKRFDNLLINITVTTINQAFVSDITYFELERFYYITFIMDAYTRYIVGHSVSNRLTTEKTTLPALYQAIKTRKGNLPPNIIFHSDGGGQYYDKDFLALTKHHHFKNSMCEYAYENGKAERINGTIKNNYLKHRRIKSYLDLVKEVDRAVSLYNNDKPHKALNYQTPFEVEKQQVYLQQQTKSMLQESFDTNGQQNRTSNPLYLK